MKQTPKESDPDNCGDAAELVTAHWRRAPVLVHRSATGLVAALVNFTDHNTIFVVSGPVQGRFCLSLKVPL
jgi:hypothetical protein